MPATDISDDWTGCRYAVRFSRGAGWEVWDVVANRKMPALGEWAAIAATQMAGMLNDAHVAGWKAGAEALANKGHDKRALARVLPTAQPKSKP